MRWFMKCLRQYADFDGRARRTEYWVFHLVAGLIAVGVVALFVGLQQAGILYLGALVPLAFVVLCWLALLIPSIAVTSRRLHDTGKSGWLQLIGWFVPFGGIVIFAFTVSEGHRGRNQYGPDPKTPSNVGPPYTSQHQAGYPAPTRRTYPPAIQGNYPTAVPSGYPQGTPGPVATPRQYGQADWWNRTAAAGPQQPSEPGVGSGPPAPVGPSQAAQRFCPRCATPTSAGRFCGSCGAAL